MIKRLVIAVVLIAVVCGGLVGFNLFRQKMIEQFFANMPRPTVTVSAIESAAIEWLPGIEAFGTAGASRGVDVAVETSGIIRRVAFAANEQVKAGQLLVQLDDAIERADLIAARASVERDRQALERTRSLASRGISPTVNLETTESALASSRSQLQRLEAVLEQKSLEAPFAGIMGIPRVELGAYVAAGTVVATLQNLDQMRVDFTVREQDLPSLRIGQPVRAGLKPDALSLAGRIIGIEPKIDAESRMVSVRAEIGNAEGTLRPGQFVRLEVVLPPERGVIVVPQTAVVSSLYGDYVYVVVKDAAAAKLIARQIFVKTGRRAGDIVEIVGGLAPGQQVVSAGQNRLFNGVGVAIDNSGDLAKAAAAPNGPGS